MAAFFTSVVYETLRLARLRLVTRPATETKNSLGIVRIILVYRLTVELLVYIFIFVRMPVVYA